MATPSSDQRTITVSIAGRPYPLRVAPQEEKTVREMADEIERRFNDFQVKFNGRDKIDCLVMTLLIYGDELRLARLSSTNGEGSVLADRLGALSKLVDGML